MALLEAAACGCAVCGTNVGALRDLAARQAALACAPAEPAALAGVMQQALADRAPLAARGGEIVEREYSLPSICARLSALYARLHLSRETYGDTDIVAA
jgi:glycosyltransferase involved in cell wall biosynthesis